MAWIFKHAPQGSQGLNPPIISIRRRTAGRGGYHYTLPHTHHTELLIYRLPSTVVLVEGLVVEGLMMEKQVAEGQAVEGFASTSARIPEDV